MALAGEEFGAVEAEGFDADEDLAGLGDGDGALFWGEGVSLGGLSFLGGGGWYWVFFFFFFFFYIPTSSILSTSGPPGSWITIAFIIFFQ